MSIKTIQTRLFISGFSNLKEKEIEQCRLKIILLEKLMINYPSQKILTIKYQNYLLRIEQLLNINRELKTLKNYIYSNNNRNIAFQNQL